MGRLWNWNLKTRDLDPFLCKDNDFGGPNTSKQSRRGPWIVSGVLSLWSSDFPW